MQMAFPVAVADPVRGTLGRGDGGAHHGVAGVQRAGLDRGETWRGGGTGDGGPGSGADRQHEGCGNGHQQPAFPPSTSSHRQPFLSRHFAQLRGKARFPRPGNRHAQAPTPFVALRYDRAPEIGSKSYRSSGRPSTTAEISVAPWWTCRSVSPAPSASSAHSCGVSFLSSGHGHHPHVAHAARVRAGIGHTRSSRMSSLPGIMASAQRRRITADSSSGQSCSTLPSR